MGVAREELITNPGVGEKTADVVLLFNTGKRVLPVDRHITNIAKRLKLVSDYANYDETPGVLEVAAHPPETYLDAHIIFIQFGRYSCRAQNPKCP